jgi:hypothetical protein
MYVGGQALPTNIHFLVKFRISNIHNVLDIKLIFLKLWIFTNFYTVFPVLVLVFDFEEFSEEVLHGHLKLPVPPLPSYTVNVTCASPPFSPS